MPLTTLSAPPIGSPPCLGFSFEVTPLRSYATSKFQHNTDNMFVSVLSPLLSILINLSLHRDTV